jgi:hypothetical protein
MARAPDQRVYGESILWDQPLRILGQAQSSAVHLSGRLPLLLR